MKKNAEHLLIDSYISWMTQKDLCHSMRPKWLSYFQSHTKGIN